MHFQFPLCQLIFQAAYFFSSFFLYCTSINLKEITHFDMKFRYPKNLAYSVSSHNVSCLKGKQFILFYTVVTIYLYFSC